MSRLANACCLMLLCFMVSPVLADDALVEYSVFEKVYLNQSEKQILDQKETQYSLDRFNSKVKIVTPEVSSSTRESSNYNFNILVSERSEQVVKRYNLSSRGYEYLLAGDYEMAIFYYTKFLEEYGDDLDVLTAIGSAYHRLGDLESSKKYYRNVLLEDPDNEIALNNYIVLIGQDAPEDGIRALQKINQLHNNKIVSAQLGYFYALKKDYHKATEAFEEAFKMDNQDIKLSYNLALSYDNLGESRSAYLLYKQILYNAKYRENQSLIPRDLIKKRYKYLEKLIQNNEAQNGKQYT